MRSPKIYQATELTVGNNITLDVAASAHLVRVLRLKVGSSLIIFNGQGGEYSAELITAEKKQAVVVLKKFIEISRESPLQLHLAQGISRGNKMDYTIQKAVELGVHKITPLFTEYCNVQLSGERLNKKVEHWRAIIISACEQCGRNYIPELVVPEKFSNWINSCGEQEKLILDPIATQSFSDLAKKYQSICLLVGSEGGLSEQEVKLAQRFGFQSVRIGPRILRTETAAMAAISAIQSHWGDF
jgi:16S rRNA (uracil1498-N3)-methyltransferase